MRGHVAVYREGPENALMVADGRNREGVGAGVEAFDLEGAFFVGHCAADGFGTFVLVYRHGRIGYGFFIEGVEDTTADATGCFLLGLEVVCTGQCQE
jgi:hypothetical protein